ncbi:MAG: hypothetical protein V1494_08435 [Candidatus Diapherotrites archaeon]
MKTGIALFAFLVCALVLFSGCPEPPKPLDALPPDFKIAYGTGAMHLEWGRYEFAVDAEGKAYFTKEQGMFLGKTNEFTVSKEELLAIYNSAIENGFFSLNAEYSDPSIMDGGWSRIDITANGGEKKVTLSNTANNAFDAVEKKINEVISAKLGEGAYSFIDLMDECPAKIAECEAMECGGKAECDLFNAECDEWKEFCKKVFI